MYEAAAMGLDSVLSSRFRSSSELNLKPASCSRWRCSAAVTHSHTTIHRSMLAELDAVVLPACVPRGFMFYAWCQAPELYADSSQLLETHAARLECLWQLFSDWL